MFAPGITPVPCFGREENEPGGRQAIDPGSLYEFDSMELAVIYEEKKTSDTGQRHRDVPKSAAVLAGGRCTYVIMEIKNQDQVHYDDVFR